MEWNKLGDLTRFSQVSCYHFALNCATELTGDRQHIDYNKIPRYVFREDSGIYQCCKSRQDLERFRYGFEMEDVLVLVKTNRGPVDDNMQSHFMVYYDVTTDGEVFVGVRNDDPHALHFVGRTPISFVYMNWDFDHEYYVRIPKDNIMAFLQDVNRQVR